MAALDGARAWVAFATATIESVTWLGFEVPGNQAVWITLGAFGALTAALAFGLDARRARGFESARGLLPLSAALIAGAGWTSLETHESAWLVALAAAHVVLGLAAVHAPRISRTLALVALATGIALADVALSTLHSGLPLVLVFQWLRARLRRPARRPPPPGRDGRVRDRRPQGVHRGAPFFRLHAAPASVRLARPGRGPGRLAAARRDAARGAVRPGRGAAPPAVARVCDAILGPDGGVDWLFAAAGLVAQLALAIGHVLAFDAPLEALAGPTAATAALAAVGAIAVVAFASARIADGPGRSPWMRSRCSPSPTSPASPSTAWRWPRRWRPRRSRSRSSPAATRSPPGAP